jgi:mandelamide amidase
MRVTRREFLLASAATGAALMTNGSYGAATGDAGMPWTVTGLAELIAAGKLKPAELVAEVTTRVNAAATLGAFIAFEQAWMADGAVASAMRQQQGSLLSPLDGIPIAFKDNIDVAGTPTTAGTPALAHHVPRRSASAAQRLFDAGALMGGKANMHELAGGGTTNNVTFGRARNPYNLDHIPGGSSGGSAVAVAARLVPAAIGSDSAGSIRNPAHFCGIVGFKASLGRYPADGVVPLSRAVDTVGPMTLNVADAALIDGYLANDLTPLQPVELKGLRLGVPRSPFHENLHGDVAELFNTALTRLTDAGATLIEAEIPDLKADIAALGWLSLGGQLKADLELYFKESGATLSVAELAEQIADPFVREWMLPFLDPTPDLLAQYQSALTTLWPACRTRFQTYLSRNRLDAIIFPTCPVPAGVEADSPGDMIIDGQRVVGGSSYNIQNTHAASLWGAPGISVPMGMTQKGLPIGLEIDGAVGSDRRLLAIAMAVEETLPQLPPPPNHARDSHGTHADA